MSGHVVGCCAAAAKRSLRAAVAGAINGITTGPPWASASCHAACGATPLELLLPAFDICSCSTLAGWLPIAAAAAGDDGATDAGGECCVPAAAVVQATCSSTA